MVRYLEINHNGSTKEKRFKQESSSGSERMVTQYWSAEYKDDIKKKIILVAISVVEIKQIQRLVQSSNPSFVNKIKIIKR